MNILGNSSHRGNYTTISVLPMEIRPETLFTVGGLPLMDAREESEWRRRKSRRVTSVCILVTPRQEHTTLEHHGFRMMGLLNVAQAGPGTQALWIGVTGMGEELVPWGALESLLG
jgi:hypothetical protein